MDQINAEVDCDVSRLDFPLRAWKARQGHNFVALFRRVPADVTKLFVRVFKSNNAYFDITAHEHPDGGWTVRIPAACFPFEGVPASIANSLPTSATVTDASGNVYTVSFVDAVTVAGRALIETLSNRVSKVNVSPHLWRIVVLHKEGEVVS